MEFQTRKVRAGALDLNVAEAGPVDGPLVILLHGFPEFWFEWRELIGPLAEAGFRVVAPDQRGYNLSDKPKGVDAYRLDLLAGDIFALAAALGRDRFSVVGHDWGASVAWWMATIRPQPIERLAIMNAPHPAVWKQAMTTDPEQRNKSRYVQMLRIPALPELMVRAGGYKGLSDAFASSPRPEAFTPQIMARYQEAWRRPGALTGGFNWYRALFRAELAVPAKGSIGVPTLVLWGDQDPFAEAKLAEESAALCASAEVVHFPHASHWLPHDEPDGVSQRLLAFLRG
ncbi:alpha/beta fold hydrolase [Phenylobacterium soli]|uniref:alpha/beta fold hydrolase n=1 Tax=Phenylobacterium soli TaxID=2170551 RepID=UPI001D053617|nr:alpha/beta hydrolase [Phenylobacterium soli]